MKATPNNARASPPTPLHWLAWWLKSAWLTLRFVDKRSDFPALWSWGGAKMYVRKGKSARIELADDFVVEPWLGGNTVTSLVLSAKARLIADYPIAIGDGGRIFLAKGAEFLIGTGPPSPLAAAGLVSNPFSGFTANCVILVQNRLVLGRGSGPAWECYITDSDWHPLGGGVSTQTTEIGDMVWIQPGVRILSGSRIGHGTIIAANSVVLGGEYPDSCLLAGVPAKVKRENLPLWSLK